MVVERNLDQIIDEAWQTLLDVDDRTSPAEYPDMALITRDELADFMALSATPIAAPGAGAVTEADAELLDQAVAFAEMWGTEQNWPHVRDAYVKAIVRERAALSSELAEAKRREDEHLEELGRVIMACPMSPDFRTSPASKGVRNLRAAFEAAEAEVARLTAREKELLEALEPFAAYIKARDENDGDIPDNAPAISYAPNLRGDNVATVRLGDFRRVRALQPAEKDSTDEA